MNIFSMDSVFYRFISKLGDLMVLNILFLICCLPVFTIGASATALYSMLLKQVRNESGYVARGFIQAFKENFKQSTIIWVIMAAIGCIFYFDILLSDAMGGTLGSTLKVVFLFLGILYLSVLSYVFSLLSRFENTIWNTLKNAFWMAVGYLPLTVSVLVLEALPLFIIYMRPKAFWYLLPIMVVLGFSGLGYFCTIIFNYIFKRYMKDEK
jgi:uncharacterized membrane protein YesL